MNKMSESGFTGWKDEQDFKKEGINPENPIIRRITILTYLVKLANNDEESVLRIVVC